MEKELRTKLQLIAMNHNKNEDLSVYVRNGNGMYVDEAHRQVKFNHIASQCEAIEMIDEIVSAFVECGYTAQYLGQQKLGEILSEYIISYQK